MEKENQNNENQEIDLSDNMFDNQENNEVTDEELAASLSELENSDENINNDDIQNTENPVNDELNDINSNEINIENDIDNEFNPEINKMITVRPIKFQQFENTEPNRSIKKNLDILQDISMHVNVELGRTKSTIKEVMEIEQGSIVELDKIAGEQVEIYVNEKLVAKGEVIVIEDKFGVRVTSTNLPKQEI